MEVVRYHKEKESEWNSYVAESKNATFLLDRNFMDYHSDRFHDHSLMIYNEGKLCALVPANEVDGELYSHMGLTYGGVLIKPGTKMDEYLMIFHAVLEYLDINNLASLSVKDTPSFYHQGFAHELKYLAFLLNAEPYRRDITVCHDNQNPDKFSSRRKRGAKKAKKLGVELETGNDFQKFWRGVLTPNLKEKYGVEPVHSVEEITLLGSQFPENIIQVNAVHQGDVIAGSTLFIMQDTVHAQYISANDEGREGGALDLIFEYLINEKFANKRYFDFGIVNESGGTKINKGLMEWKEGFGSRVAVHDFYRFTPDNRHKLDNIYL